MFLTFLFIHIMLWTKVTTESSSGAWKAGQAYGAAEKEMRGKDWTTFSSGLCVHREGWLSGVGLLGVCGADTN